MKREEVLRRSQLENRPGKDERDKMIKFRADTAGYFMMLIVIVALYLFDLFVPNTVIDVRVLFLILFSSSAAQLVARYKLTQDKNNLVLGFWFGGLAILQIILLVNGVFLWMDLFR